MGKTSIIERRHDIDWIRVIAIGLLLVYHISISFQPWAKKYQFLQTDEYLEQLWVVMSLFKIWRIPILFFISGMGVFFALRRRNWKLLILERIQRILVPLIFGYFFIVPLHVFIFQKYYNQDLNYLAGGAYGFAHLWFLANIFIYVVILSPIFFLFKQNYNSWIFRISRIIIRFPLGIYIFIIPFVLEVLVLKPYEYGYFVFTHHGFVLGFMAFFFGFYFVALGNDFWKSLENLKFINLVLAIGLYFIRLKIFAYKAPVYLISIESMLWIFTILGLGYSYLNHKSIWINYLSKAAYPIYVIHMLFQYLTNYLIFPLNLNIWVKYFCVIIFTFSLSIIFYEYVINRLKFIRPLFGLKYKN